MQTRFEVSSQQTTTQSVYNVNRFRLLEERNRALKLEVATLRQEKQQYRKLVNFPLTPPHFCFFFRHKDAPNFCLSQPFCTFPTHYFRWVFFACKWAQYFLLVTLLWNWIYWDVIIVTLYCMYVESVSQALHSSPCCSFYSLRMQLCIVGGLAWPCLIHIYSLWLVLVMQTCGHACVMLCKIDKEVCVCVCAMCFFCLHCMFMHAFVYLVLWRPPPGGLGWQGVWAVVLATRPFAGVWTDRQRGTDTT